jgi:isochorismate pyruvate lyase
MTGMARDPKTCADMAELRALIDALDADLVALLARRAKCIDRAVELKQQVGWPARIESRVEDVVEKVREQAGSRQLDADLVERLWRELIAWSIAREEVSLGTRSDAAEEL